jgi:DNA-binding NarL/FixJ family response regulator
MGAMTATSTQPGAERDAWGFAAVAAPAPMKVLIADDHPLIIAGVRRSLEDHDDIEIVGEAGSAGELMALIDRRRPELVLMDLRMPGATGPELIARILECWPELRVVVLSASDDRESVDSALCAGASAFVVKTASSFDVAAVLRQVRGGGCVFHAPAPTRTKNGSRGAEVAAETAGPALTDRERTILGAVASGMTTAAISKDLWVSEHTVKFHLTNIYRKLGVSNRAGAVRYALENGFAAAA